MSDLTGSAIAVYVLTALAALVVLLTRLRLGRRREVSGRVHVGKRLLDLHTGAGVLALAVWGTFLFAPEDSDAGGPLVGIVGLGLWWVVTVAGLLMLVRWLPSHGRHAAEGQADGWSRGPGLSLLAHLGMLLGVLYLTYAYLTGEV